MNNENDPNAAIDKVASKLTDIIMASPILSKIATGIAIAIMAAFFAAKGCSWSACDLYPGGNSHAGNQCLFCYKDWHGHWHDDKTDGPCPYGGK